MPLTPPRDTNIGEVVDAIQRAALPTDLDARRRQHTADGWLDQMRRYYEHRTGRTYDRYAREAQALLAAVLMDQATQPFIEDAEAALAALLEHCRNVVDAYNAEPT